METKWLYCIFIILYVLWSQTWIEHIKKDIFLKQECGGFYAIQILLFQPWEQKSIINLQMSYIIHARSHFTT